MIKLQLPSKFYVEISIYKIMKTAVFGNAVVGEVWHRNVGFDGTPHNTKGREMNKQTFR